MYIQFPLSWWKASRGWGDTGIPVSGSEARKNRPEPWRASWPTKPPETWRRTEPELENDVVCQIQNYLAGSEFFKTVSPLHVTDSKPFGTFQLDPKHSHLEAYFDLVCDFYLPNSDWLINSERRKTQDGNSVTEIQVCQEACFFLRKKAILRFHFCLLEALGISWRI